MKHPHTTLWVALLLSTLPWWLPPRLGKAPAGAAADQIPRPEDLEPGVDTTKSAPSAPAVAPDAAAPVPAPRAPAPPVSAVSAPAKADAAKSAPAKGAGTGKTAAKKGTDRLELEATDVTGNSELPKVLYIVPWKPSELGDMAASAGEQPARRGTAAPGPGRIQAGKPLLRGRCSRTRRPQNQTRRRVPGAKP